MSPPVWVFGYGSLVWRPGFEFADSKIGYITGYKRRFWQGNDVHRGTSDRVGRVVTLIETDSSEQTWGRAFQMSDERTCREYLDNREGTLGGYATRIVTFMPSDPNDEPFPVLIYIALPCNSLYLGPSKMSQMAYEIAVSEGICGPNVEYLAKLVAFMRSNIPNVYDEHLYQLETHVKEFLSAQQNERLLKYFEDAIENEKNLFLDSIKTIETAPMEAEKNYTSWSSALSVKSTNVVTSKKFHFTDNLPNRTLRCVSK